MYPILAGIQFKNSQYQFNYESNESNDIIELVSPQLYESNIRNNLYWFGYKFNSDVSSKVRSQFIKDLKGIGEHNLSNSQIKKLIEAPLFELHKIINLYHLDVLVYPVSGRSKLVNMMIDSINDWTSHETFKKSFEFVKNCPKDVKFDWQSFEARYGSLEDKSRYLNMKQYIEKHLMPAIHQQDYFSIAQSVKSKYRPFIQDYLSFKDGDALQEFANLQAESVLIVDDINTSGSTINEILRILNIINEECNIFVYTLIGKD